MPSFKETQRAFAAHIRDPEANPLPDGIEDRRMSIYRSLFINSIAGLLGNAFPVIRSLYGEEENWHKFVRTFYKKEHNRTPHFPEIPREFVDFLNHNCPSDKPFLAELAHYEWLELYLEKHQFQVKPNTNISAVFKVLLEQRPIVSVVAQAHSYHYPVHQIQSSKQPTDKLDAPIFLLVWKNTYERIKFTELNVFSALLLEKLQSNTQHSGLTIIQALAEQAQYADTQQFVRFAYELMQDWYHKDIIIDTQSLSN